MDGDSGDVHADGIGWGLLSVIWQTIVQQWGIPICAALWRLLLVSVVVAEVLALLLAALRCAGVPVVSWFSLDSEEHSVTESSGTTKTEGQRPSAVPVHDACLVSRGFSNKVWPFTKPASHMHVHQQQTDVRSSLPFTDRYNVLFIVHMSSLFS